MADKKFVLVTGATGNQGGAVARALIAEGHRVRALTRRTDSPKARDLARLGAELAVGNFDTPETLSRAVSGVDAVFAMGTPFAGGVEVETRQTIAIVDAAKAVGVPHLVYSSVSDADRKTGIPHFDSKYKVEKHITSLGIPHTIIAPVYFMDNLFFPHILEGIRKGKLGQQLPADRKLQFIPLEDIGRFGALVIDRRDAFLGKRINIASDERSGNEMAATLSKTIGRKVEYVELPLDPLRAQSEDMASMYDWFNRVGFTADFTHLRKEFPEVEWQAFEGWASKQKWDP